ncbi:TPA: hypothetical protein HA318_02360, partial [Candidatus Micrarchaeota archaeon]|nr:hypothetical protein [Candidatus Micrarchaeota archaeon]
MEVVLQTKRIQMDSAFLRGGVRAMVMPFARPAETNFGENTGVNVGGQAASNVF